MATVPAFPGMNPYLESPYHWPEIHTWLMVELARTLNPKLLPTYRAAVETRVYIDSSAVGIPDASVYSQVQPPQVQTSSVAVASKKPERVLLPMPYEVTERYLEIREVDTKRVVTVVELLSPANKRGGQGREKYLAKRQNILSSATHFVEIDLLRKGEPMPVKGGRRADYQILVSRASERPNAERYAFNLEENVPSFPLPLDSGVAEPIIELKAILDTVCRDTAIDQAIDYTNQPQPPLSEDSFRWVQSLPKN